PAEISAEDDKVRGVRYKFTATSKDDLNQALDEASRAVPANAARSVMRGFLFERFSDTSLSAEGDPNLKNWMDLDIVWRGGLQKATLLWDEPSEASRPNDSGRVCEVVIVPPGDLGQPAAANSARIFWRPAELKPEELNILHRFYAINTSSQLQVDFGNEMRASLHSHSVAVGQALNRVLLEDGRLEISGSDYNFTEEARATESLSGLFSVMLDSHFESRFPSHPRFGETLTAERSQTLIADLYSNSRQKLPEVQAAARAFAEPLGLVRDESSFVVPAGAEAFDANPMIHRLLERLLAAGESIVPLHDLNDILAAEPFGLPVEAQRLLLTALVAERKIDFVTLSGARINRRSLDLELTWDDISGVARSALSARSGENLKRWAELVAGVKNIKSLDEKNERIDVLQGLANWRDAWAVAAVVPRFDSLPDDVLNTNIWKLAASCSRNLGAAEENISGVIENKIPLKEGLSRIAEIFADSEEQYLREMSALSIVDSFIKGQGARDEVLAYVAGCELTEDAEIEEMREQLYWLAEASYFNPSDASNRELGYLWEKFKRVFIEHYSERHGKTRATASERESLETLIQSDDWREFEMLSGLAIFDDRFWRKARALRLALQNTCQRDLAQELNDKPFCACGFRLSASGTPQNLIRLLEETVNLGLDDYRAQMCQDNFRVLTRIEQAARSAKIDVAEFVSAIRSKTNFQKMTAEETRKLKAAVLAG
ncbi:MAG: DUF6079 family protein, partial [Acidobacteria bacterium]|nr:DUF6079 family protein [Acidobacteriota bacterium]